MITDWTSWLTHLSVYHYITVLLVITSYYCVIRGELMDKVEEENAFASANVGHTLRCITALILRLFADEKSGN